MTEADPKPILNQTFWKRWRIWLIALIALAGLGAILFIPYLEVPATCMPCPPERDYCPPCPTYNQSLWEFLFD